MAAGVYSRIPMKTLLVLAFAVSSLLRPSLVLCMESTGDVRVELQDAFCCESEHASSDIAFSAKAAEDCEGCLDLSLSTHSLSMKRLSTPAPSAAVLVLPIVAELACGMQVVTSDGVDIPRARILSTTIIRC